MKLLLIHLGDIHLQAGAANKILDRVEKLKGAVMNQAMLADRVVICVTGDSAFSGSNADFIIATELLSEIKRYVEKEKRIDVPVIVVAGNHDCDFSNSDKAREAVINNVFVNGDSAVDDAVIEICLKAQNNYKDFQDYFLENTTENNRFFSNVNIALSNDYSITFNCYNTSLMSTLHEKQGGLYYPIHLLDDVLSNQHTSNIIVSLFHHPKGWLSSNNARKFFKKIESTSDIALTGHEHVASKSMNDNLEGNNFMYIEGGVLQETKNPNSSAFNLIMLDLAEEKIKAIEYIWKNNQYSANGNVEYISYKNKLGKFKNEFDFSEQHTDWLTSAGANFTHPNKDQIKLNDVFVYPNFRALPIENNGETVKQIDLFPNSEQIVTSLQQNFKILISGAENSGKTTLAKVFIRKIYDLELIPIFIDGAEIKYTGLDDFRKLLQKKFYAQYHEKLKERFETIAPEKIAVIIDDFDKIRLNIKYKYRLLDTLTNTFNNLIIIGNEVLVFEEIIDEGSLADETLSQYTHYEIAEYGHKLRYSLINQWNTLGSVETLSEEDRLRKNDRAQRIVNSIIGPNLIPAFPIFLLTILQTIEAGNPHDLKESSYGHYYQVLIIGSLGKLVRKNDEIDEYYMYLSELANYFYENRIRELSREEMEVFHRKHCELYKIKMVFDKTIEILLKSQMIEENEGNITFKYKYIYYFFTAKYLSDNLYKTDVKEKVREMCKTLYQVHSANVILFLTHHSKDIFILQQITDVARNQFEECINATLDDDIGPINKLIQEAPNFILKEKNVNEHREELLSKKDNKESNNRGSADKPVDFNETDVKDGTEIPEDVLGISASLNTAFKTLEITGQILKNHYASFQGTTKVELAQEAYGIGLRLLSMFFNVYVNSSEYIESQIGQAIEKHTKLNAERRISLARNIVFQIASRTTHGILRKTAIAVGSEKLQEIFNEVRLLHNTNAVNLIDFYIHTEFYNSFPISTLEKLAKRFESNFLAMSILKKMVIDYLYLYPTTIQRKQQICSILNISIQTQRYLEGVSSEKK